MKLIFVSKQGASWDGCDLHGAPLFSIHPSTTRGKEYVTLTTNLPGLPSYTQVDAPDGAGKYDRATRALAMDLAGRMLGRWARMHLGVELDVEVIENR